MQFLKIDGTYFPVSESSTGNKVQYPNRKDQPHTSKFKPQSSRWMDRAREVLRYHHYSLRTEQFYSRWILAFIRFNSRKGTLKPWGKPS